MWCNPAQAHTRVCATAGRGFERRRRGRLRRSGAAWSLKGEGRAGQGAPPKADLHIGVSVDTAFLRDSHGPTQIPQIAVWKQGAPWPVRQRIHATTPDCLEMRPHGRPSPEDRGVVDSPAAG